MRRASRVITSNGSNFNSLSGGSRIFRRESTTTNGPSRSSSTKWQPAKKPLCVQQSNAGKYSRSTNVRNIRRQTKCNRISSVPNQFFPIPVNIFDTIKRVREKLVELLLNIQLTILDFILEPADRIFPNENGACYPVQRFGGCSGSCCRSKMSANRSQSTTALSIRNRHHLTLHQRRTISQNFHFR